MKLFACLAVLLLFPALLVAENPDVSVNPGDPAPEFEAVDADGRVWKSSDHFGKRIVVVYFYPADMTTGCTKQACSFRDTFQELQDSGATVVGISGDSIRNHQLFRKVHSLNFRLLADEDGSIARAFGVPTREGGEISSLVDGVEETLVRGMTASRWTFIVGKDGRVIHKNTKVDAAEDGRIVLETIRQLATVAE
ncbi:MAG: peroxiredoxin [Planctomycetaceae bacterium]